MLIERKGKKWIKLQDIWKKVKPNSTRVTAVNTLKAVPDENKIKMVGDKGPPTWYLDEKGAMIVVTKAASIIKTPKLLKHVETLFRKAPSRPVAPPKTQAPEPPEAPEEEIEEPSEGYIDQGAAFFEEDIEGEPELPREEIQSIVVDTMRKWHAAIDNRLGRIEQQIRDIDSRNQNLRQALQHLRRKLGPPQKPVKNAR
jgi:hypothetical protein